MKRLKSKARGPSYSVVAHADELTYVGTRKVLVGGSLVFAAVGQASPPQDFVRLPDRSAAGGLSALLGSMDKSAAKLQLYVHPELVARSKCRYALTTDAYLRWGQRNAKGTVALIGGIESDSGVALEILIFRDRQLAQITERGLPPRLALDFDATIDAVLEDLRSKYPGVRIVFAAPLSDWGRAEADYIGAAALTGLRFTPLAEARGSGTSYKVPLAIAGTGVAAYVLAMSAGWTIHRSALATYEAAAASLDDGTGSVHNTNLDVLEQRRLFMAAERRQELLTNRGTAIIAGVGAVAGVRILELRLPAPSLAVSDQLGVAIPAETAPDVPDVHMVLSVPRAGTPALDQAKTVLRAVSRQTGMDLHLSHNGWREDPTTRTFNVEGSIR